MDALNPAAKRNRISKAGVIVTQDSVVCAFAPQGDTGRANELSQSKVFAVNSTHALRLANLAEKSKCRNTMALSWIVHTKMKQMQRVF